MSLVAYFGSYPVLSSRYSATQFPTLLPDSLASLFSVFFRCDATAATAAAVAAAHSCAPVQPKVDRVTGAIWRALGHDAETRPRSYVAYFFEAPFLRRCCPFGSFRLIGDARGERSARTRRYVDAAGGDEQRWRVTRASRRRATMAMGEYASDAEKSNVGAANCFFGEAERRATNVGRRAVANAAIGRGRSGELEGDGGRAAVTWRRTTEPEGRRGRSATTGPAGRRKGCVHCGAPMRT